jgi:hypothetical protein
MTDGTFSPRSAICRSARGSRVAGASRYQGLITRRRAAWVPRDVVMAVGQRL